MDTTPFVIEYEQGLRTKTAEVRPCCREDNIVDYAVWIDNKLAFTIARDVNDKERWVVALRNADDHIDDTVVQNIGAAIAEATDD